MGGDCGIRGGRVVGSGGWLILLRLADAITTALTLKLILTINIQYYTFFTYYYVTGH